MSDYTICCDVVECPYCDGLVGVDISEGLGCHESQREEMQCNHCDKMFLLHTSIHYSYSGEEAPCLNGGGEHTWGASGHNKSIFRCKVCQETKECGEQK